MEDITGKGSGSGRHRMILEGRKSCRLQGIVDALSFDENAVLLETVDGMLMIRGAELHVSKLSLEKGEVHVDGRVDSFVYTEKSSFTKKGEGLLTRLFG